MKWIKHDTDANMDAKLRHLRLKFGMEAYGLYWYCLERIALNISMTNVSMELDYDSILIAHDTGLQIERIELMIRYMVDIRLFEESRGRITCMKIAKRLDKSMTYNKVMRELIDKLQARLQVTNDKGISTRHDGVMTESEEPMQEEKRREYKNGQNDLAVHNDLFEKFWTKYPRKQKKQEAKKLFIKLKLDVQQQIVDDNTALRFKGDEVKHVPHPTTYLNQERWLDPIESPLGNVNQLGGLSKEAAI